MRILGISRPSLGVRSRLRAAIEVVSRRMLRDTDFSPEFYLAQNPDVAAAGVNPYLHYLRHGRAEGRLGSPPRLDLRTALHTDRQAVLVVSHDGTRTGAPVLGYNIVKALLPRYDVIALFLGLGPMVEACRAAGAIVVGPVKLRGDPRLADAVVRRLTEQANLAFALVNSVESRDVLPALARHDVPALSLVHEFAANIRPASAFDEVLLWSGQTVFSSALTREDALARHPELAGREYPMLAQGRCLLPPGDRQQPDGATPEAARVRAALRPEGFPRDGLVVLGAGYVHVRKGVDLFLDCAARLKRAAPDLPFRFVWIGKGYDPEVDVGYSVYLQDQVRRAGLGRHVAFLEEVANLDAAYANADLFLVSSRLDPLPNVAIDALAAGIPVLCFEQTTGIADLLREQGLAEACVATYLDTADLARKVLALATSRDRRAEVGAAASRIAATFDMDAYVARLEALAVAERPRVDQARRDRATIAASGLVDLDYYRPPGAQLGEDDALRMYLRSWASGIGRRKLFPGFHPGIYAERHHLPPGTDPLVEWLRAGQPPGPWSVEVIRSTAIATPPRPGLRVALHVHAHYSDLLEPILERLERNRVRPDLLVSVTSQRGRHEVEARLRRYRGGAVDVRLVPNRGRDIGPLLTEFRDALGHGYDIVGHVHTKKTADIADASVGRRWYEFLLENLLGGDAPMADLVVGRMAAEPALALVFPDDPNVIGWGENLPYAERLLSRFGMAALPRQILFPVGTMFWARPAALRDFLDLELSWDDYPPEPLPYDGSLLHGLERLLGVVVAHRGGTLATTYVKGRSR